MFVSVRLLKGWAKPLWYKVPPDFEHLITRGSILQVPLRAQLMPALVTACMTTLPKDLAFEVRELSRVNTMPQDPFYQHFLAKINRLYYIPEHHVYQRLVGFLSSKVIAPEALELSAEVDSEAICQRLAEKKLTAAQQGVVDHLVGTLSAEVYAPQVLYGVTGSGKTHVYLHGIAKALEQKKTVIFLVPEVGLACQFERLFRSYFAGHEGIFGFHSASTAAQKKALWQGLCRGDALLIVGVHLPIIAPISNLGLIIVDEEHESGFQEKKQPRFNSKELALLRAQIHKIPIMLGSATPSVLTLHHAHKNSWPIFRLKERFGGAMPKVERVSLTTREKRTCFWITNRLAALIEDRLRKQEQAILYINRRGYSFFIQCKNCAHIMQCPDCSVSLTLHQDEEQGGSLRCHYCAYHEIVPARCVSCNAPGSELLKKGIGTQLIVETLKKMFPAARVARADMDTTSQKKNWHKTVEAMQQGELDILVGTQSITKGYHFPKVTLVGVIWADLSLSIPLFNTAETTLQQLIQVAGRAGRASHESTVVVQYMHEHPIFGMLNEIDYEKFYEAELEARKAAWYPPWSRFVQLELKHQDAEILDADANFMVEHLYALAEQWGLKVQILGPAKPMVYKIKNIETRHICLKSAAFSEIYKLLDEVFKKAYESSISVMPT